MLIIRLKILLLYVVFFKHTYIIFNIISFLQLKLLSFYKEITCGYNFFLFIIIYYYLLLFIFIYFYLLLFIFIYYYLLLYYMNFLFFIKTYNILLN